MKHVIAYIFILMFSFQALPVQQLSKLLFKKCTVEECNMCMETDMDDSSEQDIKKETDPFRVITEEEQSRSMHLATVTSVAIQLSEQLPPHYAPDIVTPPPNRI